MNIGKEVNMIKIDHLSKRYENFNLDISMEIPEGCVTGIVGKNGAGKSTTIKAILGLIEPDGGSVTVFGKAADKLDGSDKERMGIAFAESGFSNYIDIEAAAGILKKMYSNFDEEFFFSQVKAQELPLKKKIKEFSTGMKAKLRVLVAMSHKAELLILDEPTAGLDVMARNSILDLLRNYIAEDDRRSILSPSHISGDLEGLCDDIYMIHNGRVILHEDTDVLLGSYAVLKVTDEMFEKLDKTYLVKTRESSYGYTCFTNEKQYYADNYPGIVIENGSIDELIVMMAAD